MSLGHGLAKNKLTKGIKRSYGNFTCVIIKGQMVAAELLCPKHVFGAGDKV